MTRSIDYPEVEPDLEAFDRQRQYDDEYITSTFGPLENGDVVETTNPKAAFGAAKAPFFGIPPSAIAWLGNVMGGGGYKYGLYNYRKTRIEVSTYHDAILRHFFLYMDGEDDDPESGAPHLAHIMACAALMLDAHENGMLDDNRDKTGRVRDILDRSKRSYKEFREAYDSQPGTPPSA